MKTLHAVVQLYLIATVRTLSENIEDERELLQKTAAGVEAESDTNTRTIRCSSCSEKFNIKSSSRFLTALQSRPGAEVHTQQFIGCSRNKGCAEIKATDGRIVKQFGNQDAFKAAVATNKRNEPGTDSLHEAGTFGNAFQRGGPGNRISWWMNQDSSFRNGSENFEKFRKSQSFSFSHSGTRGANVQFGRASDLGADAFLGGAFSAGASRQGRTFGVGAIQANAQGKKDESVQLSHFRSSFFNNSNNGKFDLPKIPFFNGGVKARQAGFQPHKSLGSVGAGFKGAQGAGFSPGISAGQNSGFNAGSSQNSMFSFSSSQNTEFTSSQNLGFRVGKNESATHSTGFGTSNQSFNSGTKSLSQNVRFRSGSQGGQGGFGVQDSFRSGISQSAAFNQGHVNFSSTGFKYTGYPRNHSNFESAKKSRSIFTGSSPQPFTMSTVRSNFQFIQNTQTREFGNNISQIHSGGELQQACFGLGYVCLYKTQCYNGVVNSSSAVLQAKSSKQYCNIKTEICCRIELSLFGGNQGSLGAGLATFQGSSQGGLFATGQNTQKSNALNINQSGLLAASQSRSNFRSSSSGTSNRGSFQGSKQATAGSSGSNFQFESNSFGSSRIRSGVVNKGSAVSSFESQGSFESNKFSTGFSTGNKGSIFNQIYKLTSKPNFIKTDSSSSSDLFGVYRPGAIGSGLKPGIPYLPPVDSATRSSFVSTTTFLTQRPFSTPTTPRSTPSSTRAPEYLPPAADDYNEGSIFLDYSILPPPSPRSQIQVKSQTSSSAAQYSQQNQNRQTAFEGEIISGDEDAGFQQDQEQLNAGEKGYGQPLYASGNRNELEDFAEIPWQVMVLRQSNERLLCGGVITRPSVVVTSATCVDGLDAANVLIKVGDWKQGIDEETLPFQIVQVKHILRQPMYKSSNLDNDLAILVLSEKLQFAHNIFPIYLPSANDTLDAFYNGAGNCIVTGWGKQVLQSHLAGAIMPHSVNVSLINSADCQDKLWQEHTYLPVQNDQESSICAQSTNPTANICKLDTGSALACTTGDGHYVLRGIYSWDSGCQPGKQLTAFSKFDPKWYASLLDKARNSTSELSKQIISVDNGRQVSGEGGGFGQFNQSTGEKTELPTSQGDFTGRSQILFGSEQGFTSSTGQGFTSGNGQIKFTKTTGQLSTIGTSQDQFRRRQNQFGGVQGQFGGVQGQFGGVQGQFGGVQGFVIQSSSYTVNTSGSDFNPQLNGSVSKPTFSEKKIFGNKFTKIPSSLTKPEAVTYRPVYYTYTTKPKISTNLIKFEEATKKRVHYRRG